MNIEERTNAIESVAELLDQWLAYQAYIHELPALCVGIELGGRKVFQNQFGFADLEGLQPVGPETMFRIASHSKLFTSTALMRLKAAGKLRLDDRVVKYLDWFRSPNDLNLEQVTLRHLLTHGGGVQRDGNTLHWTYDQPFPNEQQLVDQVASGISVYPGGARWKYSNLGFAILGQVIGTVTGATYNQAVLDLVLNPLGLKNTVPDYGETPRSGHAVGYSRKLPGEPRRPLEHVPARAMSSAAGFSSTVGDLLDFYRAHRLGEDILLEDHDKREMQRVQFKDAGYEWGLGFACRTLGSMPFVGHGGRYPGFITFSGLSQEQDLTIVVLTNAVDGPARDIFQGIASLLHFVLAGKGKYPAETNANAGEVQAAAGLYRSLFGDFLYGGIGGRLVGFSPDMSDPASEMDIYERVGPLRYRIPVRDQVGAIGEDIRFELGEQGKVDRVITPGKTARRIQVGHSSTG